MVSEMLDNVFRGFGVVPKKKTQKNKKNKQFFIIKEKYIF